MFNFRRLSVKDENNAMANFETTDVTHSTVVCDSLNQTFSSPLNEFLDLETFKTMPCSNAFQHNFKNCSFFHNVKDMRRPGGFYSSELCKNADNCEMKEACPFSHNYIEQMYQVEKYKTKFCTHYPNNLKQCEYGEHCSYAHSENEILIDLIHNYEFDEDFYMFHYKTIWCPFNINNHDKSLCVYAHNWQDFRRKPHLFDYEENACSLWKYNEIIFDYSQGCPNGLTCKFSHGWKELEYHPLHYKLKLCNLGNNCLKGFACAFFHQKKDRRFLLK